MKKPLKPGKPMNKWQTENLNPGKRSYKEYLQEEIGRSKAKRLIYLRNRELQRRGISTRGT